MDPINGAYPPAWREYLTQTGIGLEEVPAVRYSTKNYRSGVTQVLNFFDTTEGSRLDLTNMQVANMFANPEAFLLTNIRIFYKTPVQSDDSGAGDATALVSQFNDLVQLANGGVLQLKIGNKDYGPWPMWMLPANSFIKGAFSTGSDLAGDYGQGDGNLYPLEPNLMIATMQPFKVSIVWPEAAITLSTGAESDLPIQVLFDGRLSRSIQ